MLRGGLAPRTGAAYTVTYGLCEKPCGKVLTMVGGSHIFYLAELKDWLIHLQDINPQTKSNDNIAASAFLAAATQESLRTSLEKRIVHDARVQTHSVLCIPPGYIVAIVCNAQEKAWGYYRWMAPTAVPKDTYALRAKASVARTRCTAPR